MNYKDGFYFKSSLLFAALSMLFIPAAVSMATQQGLKSALSYTEAKFKPSGQDEQDKQKSKRRVLSYMHEPPEVIEIVKVSGYKSDNWVEDFELKLKNKSDKPIYYVLALLEVPEMNYSNDLRTMLTMEYGDHELYLPDKRPKDLEKSPHFQPNETITLKIPENQRTNFKKRVEQRLREVSIHTDNFSELILGINLVRFADGSGYHGTRKLGSN